MKETAKLRKIITKRVVFVTNIRELYSNLVVKLQEFTYTIGAAKRIQIMSEYVNIRPSDTGDIYCIYATSIK
ncbi:MAG: hypothetical protein WBP64_04970 [Nitrososphaeraceae archaeon]